jgi:hypothetical protein
MVKQGRWIISAVAGLLLLFATVTLPTSAAGSDAGTGGSAHRALLAMVGSRHPCGWHSAVPKTYRHVIWIWMENKSYSKVIGSSAAPYQTSLAHRCATAPHYADAGQKYNSLSNYIGATSGRQSCQGSHCPAGTVTTWNDCQPSASCQAPVNNLFRQVRRSGGTAKSFAESMTQNCQLRAKGRYAARHNPAVYYTGRGDRRACRRDDVPMGTTSRGAFRHVLTSNKRLPRFSFVTPNLCNDTHDCSVATGDKWLSSWMRLILNSPAYRSGNTAVMVVYDENTPCPNIFIAPTIRAHSTSTRSGLGHFALLKTTEQMLGIHRILGHAAQAPSFRSVFRF